MSPKPYRRSQAISPFGVGAMVDFPGPVSLIACGLDAWPFNENDPNHREFVIDDEKRLSTRLGIQYFIMPPDFRYAGLYETTATPNLNLKMPFLRFPLWHVCPRCGIMKKAVLHERTAPICEGPVATGAEKGKPHKKRKTVQVRFITACCRGHLSDFPWQEWVHKDPDISCNETLRMMTSGSASLAGVRIRCDGCGKSRTLAGAFEADPLGSTALTRLGIQCSGELPWLGIPSPDYPAPGCGEHLHLLLRGSSSVYFSHVVSSIFLPTLDYRAPEDVLEILDNTYVWQFLSMSAKTTSDHKITMEMVRVVLENFYPEKIIDKQILLAAGNRKLSGSNTLQEAGVDSDDEEMAFRRQEYNLFRRDVHEGYPKTNLLIQSKCIANYEPLINEYFEQVSLVHKLRETRAFTGFSRIFPESNLTREQLRDILSRERKPWLPAVVVRGEGIFFKFKEDRLRDWLSDESLGVESRIRPLNQSFGYMREKRHLSRRHVSTRFVLLHTFSHLLMNQLIYECGYGSASLRERLYCSDDANHPMAGILIYTAAGDSEGTMGGLVRMGRSGRLEGVFRRAIEKARWCSTDPVCIESKGQGPDNCNLAACHCCVLMPETSCEEQNRLLDRALLVGTIESPNSGFFHDILQSDNHDRRFYT